MGLTRILPGSVVRRSLFSAVLVIASAGLAFGCEGEDAPIVPVDVSSPRTPTPQPGEALLPSPTPVSLPEATAEPPPVLPMTVFGAVRLVPEERFSTVFGFAVTASRDGATIAVGDSARETERKYNGTVSVFDRSGPRWSETDESSALILESPDDNDWEPVPDDRDWVELASSFGSAVAMSADGNTIVVGAPDQLPYGYDSGAAYVFTRPDGGWGSGVADVATLTASAGARNNRFGGAVAVSADGRTIAVGSGEFSEAGRGGAVYVFARPDAGWSDTHETARLAASGYRSVGPVAVSADGAVIVAGQPEDFGSAEPFPSYAGSAYVFERPGPGWEDTDEPVLLSLSDGMEEDYFGSSVAVTDDAGMIVIGAPGRDASAQDQGAVFLYSRPGTGWADAGEPVQLTAFDGAERDFLGISVSVGPRGDMIVVGAQEGLVRAAEDQGLLRDPDFNPGAVYAFAMPEGGWADANETAKLVNPGGVGPVTIFSGGVFGVDVGLAGEAIIVGAPGVAVYLFDSSSLLRQR